MKEKNDGFMASALKYTAFATALPATTFAGYLIGYGLDKWLGTSYLKIVFLILGIVSGCVELIRQIVRDSSKE